MFKENPEKAIEIVDEIIRNTYRTLMTRGQKGCFVYCTNKALETYFLERLNEVNVSYEKNEFFKADSYVAEDSGGYGDDYIEN